MSRVPGAHRDLFERIRGIEKTVQGLPVAARPMAPVVSWEDISPVGGTWIRYTGGTGDFAPPGYMKSPDGRVWLRGMIANGASGETIWTMDAGYRPDYRTVVPTLCYGPGAARIDVTQTGDVIVVSFDNNTYVALDGVTWRAAA